MVFFLAASCFSWLRVAFHVESTLEHTQNHNKRRMLSNRMYSKSLPPLRYLIASPYKTWQHTYKIVHKIIHIGLLCLGWATSITSHYASLQRSLPPNAAEKQHSSKVKKTSARCCESCLRLLYLNRKLILRTYINSFALAVPLSLASMRLSLCAQSACRSIILAVNAASHCG